MRIGILLRAAFIGIVALAIVGEEAAMNKGSPIAFGSEVPKILEILINSLYTNRDVFLREVISNGSDALDKIRVLYLTTPKDPRTADGEAVTMDMRIRVDTEKRQLVFRDGGVGMTKEELGSNLGTLGASGTKRFMEELKDPSLATIGQFGVGFYSVFLVAEKVRVSSKHDESDVQWMWESTGDGAYYLYEDPRGNTLGRGTEITLELKRDANEYLNIDRVKEIVHKYSEFIHFPIYIEVTKSENVKKEGGEGDDKASDEDEVRTTKEWELVNENKPIWTRKPSEVDEEDYNNFFKSFTKDFNNPMYYTHFFAEGEVEFKSILFVPSVAPSNIFESASASVQTNIQLYVRRVFITDDFKDLLPRYLNFIRGIVDSDDLPLNVSREVLQESRILKVIKKKLVRKALVMISDIALFDKEFVEGPEGKKVRDEAPTDTSGSKRLTTPTYTRFWNEYGKNLRLGIIEDSANRARLTKLLRYRTSKSDERFVSLEEYVSEMPSQQRSIYYLTGDSVEKIKQSPYLEDAVRRDIEVLFMTDAIDEYVVGHITDFADKKLVNLAKEGVKFDDGDKRTKLIETKRKEKYQPLMDWFEALLGSRVSKVTITTRNTSEPLVIASRQHDLTARMHRIMKGQALADKRDPEQERHMVARRVVELNHLHPLIDELYKRVKADSKDPIAADIAQVLFDTANLQSEFEIEDTQEFARRINRLVRQSVDIKPDATLLVEDLSEYDDDDEDEETEGGSAEVDAKSAETAADTAAADEATDGGASETKPDEL